MASRVLEIIEDMENQANISSSEIRDVLVDYAQRLRDAQDEDARKNRKNTP